MHYICIINEIRQKKIDVLKPQTIIPRNFLGIFWGNSEEGTGFLFKTPGSSEFPQNIPRKFRGRYFPRNIFIYPATQTAKYFAKIKLMVSEEIPRNLLNYTEEIPTDIRRRNFYFIIRSSRPFFPISLFLFLANSASPSPPSTISGDSSGFLLNSTPKSCKDTIPLF